jgi:GT2 family glycosyltransferase
MLYCFTPYDKRGLGHAYNEACRIVPGDDDLICIMDADIMLFSEQRWGEQLEQAAAGYPEFDVLTCKATRIFKDSAQQFNSPLREERDLVKLHNAATYRGKVLQPPVLLEGSFSGFLFTFRKSLWRQFPFPLVGSKGHPILGIDTEWAKTLRAAGKKIGIIPSLLAVHYYRLGAGDKDKSHLC